MLSPRSSLANQSGGRVTSPTLGARDQSGRQIPYSDDPVRVPSSRFVPNGYLRTGYDTGRIW